MNRKYKHLRKKKDWKKNQDGIKKNDKQFETDRKRVDKLT